MRVATSTRDLRKATAAAAVALLGAAAVAGPASAQASAWPARPIRLIVPTAPGGPTDLVARVVADKLAGALEQPVVVDNRPGAGHLIGTEVAARATPDGYTFAVVTTPHVVNPALHRKMPYDPAKDLVPVSWLTSLPLVLVVNSELPARSVQALVDLARATPGRVNMASAGNATGPHLAGELFRTRARIDVAHVPYKGGPQATTSILTGESTFYFDTPSAALPHLKSGKMRALAVTSSKRSAALPDVPTLAESGFAGFEFNAWNGMIAPAGTPPAVIARMSAEVAKALALPDVQARFLAVGFETVGSTPQVFGSLIESDLAKWRKVVDEAGIKVE